jgi:hypothetical protein
MAMTRFGDLATRSSGSVKNISIKKAVTLPILVLLLSEQAIFVGAVARVGGLLVLRFSAGRGCMPENSLSSMHTISWNLNPQAQIGLGMVGPA